MNERDPEQLARELEREADELARRSDRVEGEIAEARDDWERKRADQSVPGAPPPEHGSGDDEGERASGDAPPSKD